MGILPSFQDNQTVQQLERLADAIPSNFPLKLDGSLLNQVSATVSKAGGTLGAVAQGINNATNAIGTVQNITSKIAAAQNLVTNNNLVSPVDNGLSALANNLANTQALNFTSTPNALSAYVTYNYHIRWLMTTEAESYNVNEAAPNSDSMNKIVIAESGVTAGFNIIELTTKVNTGASDKKRNLWTQQDYTMTVNEPLGLSLMDRLLAAGAQLGVKDQNKAPYFLEIWFNGYDEDGVIIAPKQFYQIYRVLLHEINFATTAAGTVYTITFNDDGVKGESDANSTPPVGVKISATYLGEFFDQFKLFWNTASANINNDKIARITYDIQYPKAWAKWPLKNPDVSKQTARATDMDIGSTIDGNKTTISIARGQSIENIVNYVVYLCQDVQKWITGQDAAGSGSIATLKEHGLLRYVSIRSKDEITGWDTLTKSYTHKITYYLFPTESTKAYTDMETVQSILSESTQAAKLQYLIQNGRLKKRYDWIYTGLNTEVINFDFRLDNAWHIALPVYNQVNNYNQLTVGGVVDQNSVGYQATRGTQTTNQNATPANPLNPANSQQIGANLPSSIQIIGDNTPVNPAPASNSAFSVIKNDSSNTIDLSPGQRAATEALNKAVTTGTLGVNPIQTLTPSGQSRVTQYAEAITNTGFQQPQPLLVSGMFSPEPSYTNAAQNADQNKIPVQNDPAGVKPGSGFVGAVLGNLFNGSTFTSINLSIRGDPWWLPLSNIKQNQLAEALVGNAAAPNAVADINQNSDISQFLAGDNLFLLQFRPGVKIDEATGLAVNDSNGQEYFTGLYTVQEVINTFSRGQFTQVLNANKDILAQSIQKDIKAMQQAGVGPGHA